MLERQLAPLKISRSDLKRFKNHRVDKKKTHTHIHRVTLLKTYHLRYVRYRCADGIYSFICSVSEKKPVTLRVSSLKNN